MKTTEERMLESCTAQLRESLGLSPPPGGGYSHVATLAEVFLCHELDDIRGQLAKAIGQLGMLGLPEPPAEGAHVHAKVYSEQVLCTYPAQHPWICSECLEQGTDTLHRLTGPTYADLVAKKRSGG